MGSSLSGSLVDDEVGSVVVHGNLKLRVVLGSTVSKVVGSVPDVRVG